MTPLQSYLAYYSSLYRPGFAVLVTGPWGVGKTHQVRSVMTKGSCYVSLFGMRNENEVHSAILMSMYPNKKRAKALSDLLRGVNLKIHDISIPAGSIAANALDNLLLNEIDPEKTIVLDDLERSSLPPRVLLGIIDKYLQQLHCRVIVIAHEGELPEKFAKQKEKLFGQTILVKPDFNEAFTSFLAAYEGGEKGIVLQYRDEIMSVFMESGVNSLRILQQMISDLVRLYRCLSTEQVSSNNFIAGLFKWFLALSSQARAGLLQKSDVFNRKSSLMNFELVKIEEKREGRSVEEIRLSKAVSRFKTTDLTYSPLEDDVVAEMLFDGVFERGRVQESLEENPFFAKSEDVPAWRSLMEWDQLDEGQISLYIEKLRAEFRLRSISNVGEILHMLAFELMFSVAKIDSRTPDEIIEQYKAYLDDLISKNEFPEVINLDAYSYGYRGFGYWVTEDTRVRFNEFARSLADYVDRARKQRLPQVRLELVESLEAGGGKFLEKFSSGSLYEDIPVLHAVKATEFVDLLLKLHPREWGPIARILHGRKLRHSHDRSYLGEMEWLSEVESELKSRSEGADPIRAAKISRLVQWMN